MASWMTASDGAVNGVFGWSVAVSGDTAVAGAPYATVGSNYLQGAAYVFVKPSSGWATTSAFDAKLTASDGPAGDLLGYSVAVSGDTVVSGAPSATAGFNFRQGAAYVFGPCPTATTPGRHPCIEPIEPAPPVPVKGRGP